MDLDQEVVREPFEDEESVRSADQSPNHDNREVYDIDSHRGGHHNDDNVHAIGACSALQISSGEQTDQTEQLYHDDDDSTASDGNNSSSSSFVEDANFAKSFGINLKPSSKAAKGKSAYDRLMKSTHIVELSNIVGPPNKPEPIIKTSVTTNCIYHKGTFYQKGDIVALCDQDDGLLYFAQLTGFLQDVYCEKSASINWLVPIRPTSREFFDPSAYRIGLEDAQLRKLDCMTFVCHCPHDYYLRKLYQSKEESSTSGNQVGQSVVRTRSNKDQAYTWTTMKTCRVPSIETKR